MVISATTAASPGSFNNATVAGAIAAISATKKGGEVELVLYQKVSIGTGKQGEIHGYRNYLTRSQKQHGTTM